MRRRPATEQQIFHELAGRKGGIPKDVRAELGYAADAINAHQRGMSVPAVCLNYRYDPIQAMTMIATSCADYGLTAVAARVPLHIISIVQAQFPMAPALRPSSTPRRHQHRLPKP